MTFQPQQFGDLYAHAIATNDPEPHEYLVSLGPSALIEAGYVTRAMTWFVTLRVFPHESGVGHAKPPQAIGCTTDLASAVRLLEYGENPPQHEG